MLWWRPRGPHGRHRLGQADVISSYPLLMSALEPLAQLRAATVASPNVGLHPIDVAVADAPVYPTRRARRSVGPFHPRDGPALELPLVSRDGRIQKTKLVETVW